jgi:dolichyl-phosphate beta-glucosyltransferase
VILERRGKIQEQYVSLNDDAVSANRSNTSAELTLLAATKVSVIVPVFNEASILEHNVRNLRAKLDSIGVDYEILLCDDDSKDGTLSTAKSLLRDSTLCLRFSTRIGKGGTIKNALRFATGDIIALIDADIPISSSDIENAVRRVLSGRKLVMGVRRRRPQTTIRRKVFSRAFNVMVKLLFRTGIEDHQCGFKLMDRAAALILLPTIRSDHFLFDVELIANAKFLGIPDDTVEVEWLEAREDGDSKISSPKVILMMLIDMALLRISYVGRRRLLGLRQMEVGQVTDLGSGRTLTEQITVIDTTHPQIIGILRKLYLSIAFGS